MNRGTLSGVTPRQYDEREFFQTDTRYAVNTLPPYVSAGSLARPTTWDPATQTYNVTPATFANFRLALAKARAGVSPCNVDFHGDSIAGGLTLATPQTQSFPEVVRAMFQSSGEWGPNVYEGGPVNGGGNPNSSSGANDSRLTWSGGFSATPNGSWGIGGWAQIGTSTGGVITFGPVTCDTFDVYDRLNGFSAGSGWTWAVDGGAGTFVSQSGSGSGQGNRKTTISAGSYGSHTLTITAASSGNFAFLNGFGVRNPTVTPGGVYFRRCAVGGLNIGTTASGAGSLSTPVSKEFLLTTLTPHLVVISLGTNTEAGNQAQSWKSNMIAWIQACQAAGADVLLVSAPPGGTGGFTSNQLNHIAGAAPLAYQVADATNCGLLDWYWRWGGSNTSTMDAYFQQSGTGGHPNVAGHTDIALGVYRALRRIA